MRNRSRFMEELRSKGIVVAGLMLQSLLEPKPRIVHQLWTQSEHQNAELHLRECTITVQISLPHHARKLLLFKILQPHRSRVLPQTLQRDHPPLLVHQHLKPLAQLVNQTLTPQFTGDHR